MEDETPTPEAEAPKRGRPAKETAKTFMVNVIALKGVMIDAKTKAKRGEVVNVPLDKARQWVAKDLALWTDPRPDL